MKPKNQDLETWLYLELLNHPTHDQMLDNHKTNTGTTCEWCEL